MGQYGRIGKRRSGSATWQWMLLGFFPGILCGGILIFAMFASGALNSFTTANLPTQTPVIIEVNNIVTATPAPVTPTDIPPSPTENVAAPTVDVSQMQFATSTPLDLIPPTGAGTTVSLGPTATTLSNSQGAEATIGAGSNQAVAVPSAQAPETASGVPAMLSGVASGLITIPGGTFTMGTTPQEVIQAVEECVTRDGGNCEEQFGADSSPQFQVKLDTFQMEETEVTFEQYVTFLNYLRTLPTPKDHKNACPSPNGASQLCIQTSNEVPGQAGAAGSGAVITYDSRIYNVNEALLNYPVYGVTWAGAQAYCEALGRRLPTEAEWEYAAKGNDPGRLYPWGNLWNPANAKTRIPKDIPPGMVPVGSYQGGNTIGTNLKDMAGNVEEWVADWYSETYYSEEANQPQPVENPQGPNFGTQKVLRGGSWDTLPFFVRTVHRRSDFPAPDGNSSLFPRTIGFRCAADVSADAPLSSGSVNPANLGVATATPAPGAGAEATQPPSTRG